MSIWPSDEDTPASCPLAFWVSSPALTADSCFLLLQTLEVSGDCSSNRFPAIDTGDWISFLASFQPSLNYIWGQNQNMELLSFLLSLPLLFCPISRWLPSFCFRPSHYSLWQIEAFHPSLSPFLPLHVSLPLNLKLI